MSRINFSVALSHVIAKHVPALLMSHSGRKPVAGMPAAFVESDLRRYLSTIAKEGGTLRVRGGPSLLVERQLPKDAPRTCVDYVFVRKDSAITERNIVATCELKGPVRRTLFNLERFTGNWGRKLVRDARKQFDRSKVYKAARHYVALLVPHYAEWTEDRPLRVVLDRVEASVPGAALVVATQRQITLPNGVPLEIIVLAVTSSTRSKSRKTPKKQL